MLEVTALQTLARQPDAFDPREASGVRRVHLLEATALQTLARQSDAFEPREPRGGSPECARVNAICEDEFSDTCIVQKV